MLCASQLIGTVWNANTATGRTGAARMVIVSHQHTVPWGAARASSNPISKEFFSPSSEVPRHSTDPSEIISQVFWFTHQSDNDHDEQLFTKRVRLALGSSASRLCLPSPQHQSIQLLHCARFAEKARDAPSELSTSFLPHNNLSPLPPFSTQYNSFNNNPSPPSLPHG